MTRPIRIGVSGASGRMGRTVLAAAAETEGVRVAAAWTLPGDPAVGVDAGTLAGVEPLGVEVAGGSEGVVDAVDTVVDFTLPYDSVKEFGFNAMTYGKGYDLFAFSLIQAAALVHYYFDSFIWKVRDEQTQSGL